MVRLIFISEHGFCVYSYILILNESTEYIYVHFNMFRY